MSLITITSGIGCGEMHIAKQVAEGLELELYDDQRLQEKAVEMGLSLEDLKGLDEKAPGLFNRLLRRKPEVYLDILDALIYEIARQGEGILFGHGAQLLLRDFECALQVRIYSSEPRRIKYLVEHQNLTSEAAKKIIRKTDNEQGGFGGVLRSFVQSLRGQQGPGASETHMRTFSSMDEVCSLMSPHFRVQDTMEYSNRAFVRASVPGDGT